MAKQYTSIKYDIAFKRVFSKPHILKAFLNTVLKAYLAAPIVEIEYQPTDFILKSNKFQVIAGVKHTVIDIFCTDQDGRRLLVELQKGINQKAIPRFVDYQCRNYSSQFKTGSQYDEVVPCYSVCWFFDLQPPHAHLWEQIRLCSNVSPSQWELDWQIIALYPQNLDWERLLKAGTQEELEEWLLLDVVLEKPKANRIYRLIQSKTVSEAFSELDLSHYTEEQLEYMEFHYVSEHYPNALKDRDQKLLKKAEEKMKRALAKKEKEQAAALAKKEKEQAAALAKKEKEQAAALAKKEKEQAAALAKKEKEQAAALAKKEKEQAAILAKKEAEQKAALIQIAKSLLGLLDVETISQKTGLSVAEVREL